MKFYSHLFFCSYHLKVFITPRSFDCKIKKLNEMGFVYSDAFTSLVASVSCFVVENVSFHALKYLNIYI